MDLKIDEEDSRGAKRAKDSPRPAPREYEIDKRRPQTPLPAIFST